MKCTHRPAHVIITMNKQFLGKYNSNFDHIIKFRLSLTSKKDMVTALTNF